MVLDKQLKDILVCPQCKGGLATLEGGYALFCEVCKLKFPVRDDIPVMIVEEALDSRSSARQNSNVKLPRRNFKIVSGPDTNMTFQLEVGSCRAIGRATTDVNKTSVFSVDIALALDDSTRDLVLKYIGTQFKKNTKGVSGMGDGLGQFRRSPDVVLTDSSLTRLHAMVFADDSGVGVLDLVSKNGTFVNGIEIESKLLERGDRIELGETTIVFEG